jgi:tripartite-type tricarboxylate transporter receptor subunit TctC
MKRILRLHLTLLIASAACLPAFNAQAAYPERPVRMIVPFPPGGANDIVARMLAQRLAEQWGKPVVVDNRAGAGGNIGIETGARANPDGYTLTIGSNSTLATNVVLEPSLPFDPRRDFSAISMIVTAANILIVHPSLAANTTADFIKLARSNARKLNYSSFGDGSSAHLTGEMFKSAAGVDMVHIPYKGGGPALAAVMGGEVQCTFANLSVALPQVKGGKVKAIAVTSARRATALPDLPTLAESDVPGFEATASVGMLAPAGTPRALVLRLNQDVHRVVYEPAMREQLLARGLEIALSTPEEYARYIRSEIERWDRVVRDAGIRVK